MITKLIEKVSVYLLTIIITLIGIKYIFSSTIDKEIVPVILLSLFLLIMFIYIYFMNKKNEKLDSDGVILKREFYYLHKYSQDDLEEIYNHFLEKKITKKEYNEKIYGSKDNKNITIPFEDISNVRKEKNKYYMHVNSLKYDVEITSNKVLKHLQQLN